MFLFPMGYLLFFLLCNYQNVIRQKPEAFFIPDVVLGIAPLTIEFVDHSLSHQDIVTRKWAMGDGNEYDLTDTTLTHTFECPGLYPVTLSIENTAGCFDKTEPIWIEVIAFNSSNLNCPGGVIDIGDGPDDGIFKLLKLDLECP